MNQYVPMQISNIVPQQVRAFKQALQVTGPRILQSPAYLAKSFGERGEGRGGIERELGV